MNQQIQEIITQVGTDVSGKWISVDRAEKFAQLVIEQYNKELKESRRESKSKLGYSRIGLNNI
jgi:F0F1-type ATP synthase membrane subunit b/b'